MSDVKTYTIAEVKKHNKNEDLWVIIHDKVYDVTKFLNSHPGGMEVLSDAAGRDASVDFEEAGHSEAAKAQMKEFYLGDIVDIEKKESIAKTSKSSSSQHCIIGCSVLAVAIGIAILYKGFKVWRST